MKKILIVISLFLILLSISGCKKQQLPSKVEKEPTPVNPSNPTNPDNPKPPVEDVLIGVGISSTSEVRSGHSITLKSVVSNTDNKEVIWEIVEGQNYATINSDGVLTAETTNFDREVKVRATSVANNKYYGEKVITIVAKPTLTQDMLNRLNATKVGFEGYVNISLYTIEEFSKLYRTYTTVIKTSMDGTNWYAEYENGETGIKQGMYFKNHNNVACQVGVSFMNEEQFSPMLDEKGKEISWHDGGLYNSLTSLSVDDFKFNEETWRYEYVGSDSTLAQRVISSANPYDFLVDGFALIIEENNVMGIYAKSKDDYSIAQNYRAIQELFVALGTGESVKVPTISKYSHEAIHDDLQVAIDNMHALDSYTLTFTETTASYLTTGYVTSGFKEYITNDIAHFEPFQTHYDQYGNLVKDYQKNQSYGFKKINDSLYNAYYENADATFTASRAYAKDFSAAIPSFGFAPELFRTYFIDEEKGTTTYYVDDVMSGIASTMYYGVGNDINLYGIFATRGYTSQTESFTPFVVVKDGYIESACFYFYLGSIYGVVEIEYSDFNKTTKENIEKDVTFTTRSVPTSWSELQLTVTAGTGNTTDDTETNCLEYLKKYFDNENIEDIMPFFGTPLGDTYGFGLTTVHISNETNKAYQGIVFYYDVPLDINYTIESSLKAIDEYLIGLGFTKNKYGEYRKGDIYVAPTDSSLDLLIYVWKA